MKTQGKRERLGGRKRKKQRVREGREKKRGTEAEIRERSEKE